MVLAKIWQHCRENVATGRKKITYSEFTYELIQQIFCSCCSLEMADTEPLIMS